VTAVNRDRLVRAARQGAARDWEDGIDNEFGPDDAENIANVVADLGDEGTLTDEAAEIYAAAYVAAWHALDIPADPFGDLPGTMA